MVEAHGCVDGHNGTHAPRHREVGRQVLPETHHGAGIVAAVEAQAQRGRPAFVGRAVAGGGKGAPTHDAQVGLLLPGLLRTAGKNALEGTIVVAGIPCLHALGQGPALAVRAVLGAEGGLLLVRAQVEGQVVGRGVVVVRIFQVLVGQVVVAQGDGLHVAAGIVLVGRAQGEGLLLDAGQVAQHVLGVLAFLIGVQLHVVDARQAQEDELVRGREARLDLELPVDVVGQERQAQHLEKQLQVGLSDGEEVGGALAEMSRAAERHFRGTQRGLEGLVVGVAVAQADVHHGAQRPALVGREGTGVELHLADEVGVEDADGTARCALRGEVVDVRNLNAVHVEAVLRGRATAHDEVVAVADG